MQATRGKVMKMKDWQKKLDAFLKFSKYEILNDAGKVSYEVVKCVFRQHPDTSPDGKILQ
jgi:hypothetical protein